MNTKKNSPLTQWNGNLGLPIFNPTNPLTVKQKRYGAGFFNSPQQSTFLNNKKGRSLLSDIQNKWLTGGSFGNFGNINTSNQQNINSNGFGFNFGQLMDPNDFFGSNSNSAFGASSNLYRQKEIKRIQENMPQQDAQYAQAIKDRGLLFQKNKIKK